MTLSRLADAHLQAARVQAVAIGASAGGVEALLILLRALRGELACPVFVVLHLMRERPSMLAALLGRHCAVPVREPEDKEPVRTGTVYIAPPDYHLMLERGPTLSLSVDAPVNYSRPSIDVLFETAADVYDDRLAGIILTGANEDGAAGLAAVHAAGGVSLVQEPAGAQVSTMPQAALTRVPTAFVLSLTDIAAWLGALKQRDAQTTP